ncbi:MAG: hydroxymethylbilane synthase [Synergistaceae bacterium]
MKRVIRFGSRKSLLAVAQTNILIDMLKSAHPELDAELVTMETTGDRNMKPFSEASDKFGIKGLFTQELEEALTDGRIDIAVHSLKDMPMFCGQELPIVATATRGDPRDALVIPKDSACGGSPIGCSSSRRRLQISEIFPNVEVSPVRGNVITRLRKLDEHEFSMLVLAAAGLKRINMEYRIHRYLSPDEMVPAPGQGALACQGRAGEDYSYLDCIRDKHTEICTVCERAFSAALGGGCNSPVGAYAEITGENIHLRGFYADEEKGIFEKGSMNGNVRDARDIALRLAEKLGKGGVL